jgi:predicted transcriptional regulator of viral defense system
VRLRFYESREVVTALDRKGVVRPTSHTGGYNVSSPELTALDLVAHAREVGGLENIATVLSELEHLSSAHLAVLASGRPQSTIRRLCFLLDRFGHIDDLSPVAGLVDLDRAHPTPLDPDLPARGAYHPRWNILENIEIESDL